MIRQLSRARLDWILSEISQQSVLVVGDYALDGYWYADMTKSALSREAPLYNRPIILEEYSLGAAANVAWNLKNLGVNQVYAATAIGQDWRGQLLSDLLRRHHIDLDIVHQDIDRTTPFFGKVMLSAYEAQQEDNRIDFVNVNPLSTFTEEKISKSIKSLLPDLNAVIVSDYLDNGVITPFVRKKLCNFANENRKIIFTVDSRNHVEKFHHMVLKPNFYEAAKGFYPHDNLEDVQLENLILAGLNHQASYQRPVYITLGSKGHLLTDNNNHELCPAAVHTGTVDPVGAGDTFLAVMSVCLAAGASSYEAGVVASLAAGVTVHKLHTTGAASPNEIWELFDLLQENDVWPIW